MATKIDLKFWIVLLFIIFASIGRVLTLGVPNLSPITATALFGAAYFIPKKWAFLIPFAAMWITDLILNNTVYAAYFEGFSWSGNLWVYLSFVLIVFLGINFLKRVKPLPLFLTALAASILFFVVTNFGVWLTSGMYPKTFGGLISSFAAGIPFYRYTLLGDLFFTGVLFGLYELIKIKSPASVKVKLN